MAFELIPRLAKKPELSAGQAGGILKYRKLALLDSYVFWLIKARRPPRLVGRASCDARKFAEQEWKDAGHESSGTNPP